MSSQPISSYLFRYSLFYFACLSLSVIFSIIFQLNKCMHDSIHNERMKNYNVKMHFCRLKLLYITNKHKNPTEMFPSSVEIAIEFFILFLPQLRHFSFPFLIRYIVFFCFFSILSFLLLSYLFFWFFLCAVSNVFLTTNCCCFCSHKSIRRKCLTMAYIIVV